ncbi:MAG TPA: shikimate dehydrogenase [Flavobacteriales bacterium]|nr:shikimate dehydrogenase [Flavobacteriales bacterium]HRN35468.1 shikimate dehydrogenase [Flavobacteriales bacterium]HRO38993.1 shikimate dehydrogenase [Flavobacteriales bacterium]HRP81472.1 shikimate dehydrogenase [Flavobacteriales bacterium]HRQ84174.1 shikimate dehydrogenase [Flavobacteriales bacterium]
MQRYGLIGRKLGHSFSKEHFTGVFRRAGLKDHRYDLFELGDIEELTSLLRNTPDLCGLNVTIPYKEAVIPYLDGLDPLAAAVGAVNTIAIRDGMTKGYNTDVAGFRSLMHNLDDTLHDAGSAIRPRALVLGTGGASRAVAFVLREMGIRFRIVSRSRERGDLTWDLIDPTILRVCRLIINATPLGMHPDVNSAPSLPYAALTAKHVLVDLVYNPEQTVFLKHGQEHGARTLGGSAMLKAQAEEAWRIWQGPG